MKFPTDTTFWVSTGMFPQEICIKLPQPQSVNGFRFSGFGSTFFDSQISFFKSDSRSQFASSKLDLEFVSRLNLIKKCTNHSHDLIFVFQKINRAVKDYELQVAEGATASGFQPSYQGQTQSTGRLQFEQQSIVLSDMFIF